MARVVLSAPVENSSQAQLSAIKHFVFKKIAEVSFLHYALNIETDKYRPRRGVLFAFGGVRQLLLKCDETRFFRCNTLICGKKSKIICKLNFRQNF